MDSVRIKTFIDSYNWDDGFEGMCAFIDNHTCSLGQLLTIFYDAGGYDYLLASDEASGGFPAGHGDFLRCLFNTIEKRAGKEAVEGFGCPLTKVQRYKMRKKMPALNSVFLED